MPTLTNFQKHPSPESFLLANTNAQNAPQLFAKNTGKSQPLMQGYNHPTITHRNNAMTMTTNQRTEIKEFLKGKKLFAETEKPWHTNLPAGGVFCHVSCNIGEDEGFAVITEITTDPMYPFSDGDIGYTYARPAAPEIIQVLLDTANSLSESSGYLTYRDQKEPLYQPHVVGKTIAKPTITGTD